MGLPSSHHHDPHLIPVDGDDVGFCLEDVIPLWKSEANGSLAVASWPHLHGHMGFRGLPMECSCAIRDGYAPRHLFRQESRHAIGTIKQRGSGTKVSELNLDMELTKATARLRS